MKLIINFTPDGYENAWKKLLGDTMERYTPVVEKMLPDASVEEVRAVLLRMIDPLYSPISDLSGAVLMFEFDKSDVNNGIIETTVTQFTLDNRLQVTLEEIRQGIYSGYVCSKGETLEAYGREEREAFYKYVEKALMTLTDELFELTFAEVSDITFHFSKKE